MFKEWWNEFKLFALKGNVMDLAIGVIIGASFGKIVTSLVNDIITPFLGLFLGKVQFSSLRWVIQEGHTDASGNKLADAISINYGIFLQNIFDFLIVAWVIFLLIKGINRLHIKRQTDNKLAPIPRDVELLTEIRDLLKIKNP